MNSAPPNFEFIAAQLRKPSGAFAPTIAQNMDKTNEPLFDLTLQSMNLKGKQYVLEIGFGSGSFMHKLFEGNRDVKVTGIDYSAEMVSVAAANNENLVKSGSLELKEGSSEQLPFDDGTFDCVYSNMVIYFWDKPEQHLREVRRVLKPGGIFYSGFRPKKSMISFPFAKFSFNLYEPTEWQELLEKNGFKVLRTDRKMDPEMETNGQKIHLESVCIVAQNWPGSSTGRQLSN